MRKSGASLHKRPVNPVTKTAGLSKQLKTTKRSPALIPVPHDLAVLMRLVNSLPSELRRSGRNGVHELTMRHWDSASEEEAINSWFYMWRYVNELPVNLQMFVLQDDDGRRETGFGMAPLFDANHLQPYTNIELLDQTESALQDLVSTAKERINREIKIVEERITPREQKRSTPRDDLQRQLLIVSGLRNEYEVGESTFSEVGPRRLLARARQRFFFVLAAEEILDALTGDEPQEKLNNAWYFEESGAALRGHLFVQGDQVHLYPPVLFSFVVGLQVSRIHKCGICGNYFWAGRKDKKVCSEQCGATKRKRQERQRYYEIKIGDRIAGKRRNASPRAKTVVTAPHSRGHSAKKGK